MAPVVLECQRRIDEIAPIVCSTGQHREMLNQVLDYFQIQPDVDLGLMQPGQSLAQLTARCIESVDAVIREHNPDCIVVQGDTTTVMASSMVAFYHQLPTVHIEAGLRTGDLAAPWPEEFNRRVAGMVTHLHCAPTPRSRDALLAEGVPNDSIRITGNTVIDALLHSVEKERAHDVRWRAKYPMALAESVVLITGHRRENFGSGMRQLCEAIGELARRHQQTEFIYPVHLNPNVQGPVHELLSESENIHLVPPADYPEFVWLMDRACLVITDSGGVQEEAPSLGSAVLVTREKTERPEAVDAGLAELVGTEKQKIVRRASELLADHGTGTGAKVRDNPYGDGKAAPRIVDWMTE